jgi:glycosyltransferase involved in cell wall biosynthesis
VSTKPLAEKMRAYNERVEVVPNRISARLWGGLLPEVAQHAPRLLYMGTRNHEEDLAFVLPAIERARATEPDLRLSLIGVTSRADLPPWVDVIPLEQENKSYGKFVPWLKSQTRDVDLAIAPLVDGDFNRFKSGLKILDYAALGLPVLASKVLSYQDLVGVQPPVGVTLLANSEVAWTREILEKIHQRSELREQGQSLRKWVFEHHALEQTLGDYERLVLNAISHR